MSNFVLIRRLIPIGTRTFCQQATLTSTITATVEDVNKTNQHEQSPVLSNLNFEPSPEVQSMIELARSFTHDKIIPVAGHYDKTGEYPLELISEAHSLGLMNFFIPAENGGHGVSYVDSLCIQEELAYGCTGISMAMALNGLAGSSVAKYGNKEQKEKYLGSLASYPSLASFAVTEANAGSDVASLSTRAEHKTNGEWIINGEKAWISNVATGDWFYILARTDLSPTAKSGQAFTAFLVDKDTPGLIFGPKDNNMGQRCADVRSLKLENVRVTDEAILGGVGKGFKITMGAFDYERSVLACNAVGLARRALDESVKYATQRVAFGKAISNYQAIQFKLANMAIGIETARLAYLRAGWTHTHGLQNTYYASIAKTLAADVANFAASEAVQIHGGAGFNCDYPVEKLMRDAKVFQIYGGTVEIQRMLIAREIIKKQAN